MCKVPNGVGGEAGCSFYGLIGGSIGGSFSVYFLGIGGVSMSALATYLAKKGVCVSGCDRARGEFVSRLLNAGVEVDILNSDEDFYGGAKIPKGLINADLVVYTSALTPSDGLLRFCEKNGKITLSRAQLLREIMLSYPLSIGVGGTHGKTTCTCMLAHIFKRAGKKFCAHIGGFDKLLGNLYHCGNDCFITEVCEYQRNISLFSPSIGVILNADNDHLDSYGDFSGVCTEFLNYAARSGVCVYNADDKSLCATSAVYSREPCGAGAIPERGGVGASRECDGKLVSGGVGVGFSLKNPACDYYAQDIRFCGKHISFKVFERGKSVGVFKIKSMFFHNVYNALASIAAARLCGINFNNIKRGLYDFSGVERREDWLFKLNGALVFADYCHHPAQIKQTVAALSRLKSKRLTVVFQPHTYSRTKSLFEEFVCALSSLCGSRGGVASGGSVGAKGGVGGSEVRGGAEFCGSRGGAASGGCGGKTDFVNDCKGENLQKCANGQNSAREQKDARVRLIITDTYAARETYDYFGSGKRLASEILGCEYVSDKTLAVQSALGGARSGDIIAFLGAGDIYSEAKKLSAELARLI